MEADDVIVVGGGMGGLCSATLLARAGQKVRLLEQGERVGGRARSRSEHGFVLNIGAHALYRGGPASQVLAALGVEARGQRAGGSGVYALDGERLSALPQGLWSLLRSDLLGARGKLYFARLLATLGEGSARAAEGLSVSEWLDRNAPDARARRLLTTVVRLTMYANAPDQLDASLAVRALASVIRHGVIYVDGGWQSLVDQVERRALEAGVQIERGDGVARIEHAGAVQAVTTQAGRRLPARAVVAAIEPRALSALLPGDPHAACVAASATPLRVACLDLGVRELPHPERVNVQSLDAPLYFANHSAFAAVAPEGAATLQLVRYLAPHEDGRAVEPELRAFLERVQPGVYERAEVQRFVPNLIVHNDIPSARRSAGAHPAIAGLQLVGDFVDSGALLLDGVLASARAAVARVLGAGEGSGMVKLAKARDADRAA